MDNGGRMRKAAKMVRKGFTLIEILVTLLILSILVAILAPGVIGQLGKEDPVRVAEDLTAIKTGVNLFRLNVRPQFPGDLEDLAFAPSTAGDRDINGALYSSGASNKWKGPYVDLSIAESADTSTASIPTGFGGSIQAGFRKCTNATGAECVAPSGSNKGFLTIRLTGIDATQFTALNDLIDGEGESSPTSTGKLRFKAGSTSPVWSDTVKYLAVPLG